MTNKNIGLAWWQRAVFYQIYPRSFRDTSGNGVGDLRGIIESLDYLNDGTQNSLGIDAIWIGPFYPSPMADFGYDVADYCDVDPLFGDLETFDCLVEEAHKRNIRVLIDYVPNHTSDQHPWFQESRSSRDNPRRDWYIWRDPKEDGSLPNNWGSEFGGPAWEWDEATGQYYFHQYLKEQPDLNWRNPQVQEAMLDVLKFWMARGVDGFRMDVVGMIFKHPDMPDQPSMPVQGKFPRSNDLYGQQVHLYDQDQEDAYQMAQRFRTFVEGQGEKCILAEINYFSIDRWVKYYGAQGERFHLPLFHGMLELPWDAGAFRRIVEDVERSIPEKGWPNYVLGNHDIGRLASRWGVAQARVAAMLQLTLRGTPVMYYGDELGMRNRPIAEEKTLDPWGLIIGPERNRDVCRTPMLWDAGRYAGFSSVAPWLPLSPDHDAMNVEKQREDPRSLLSLYCTLIRFRRQSPALLQGEYVPYAAPKGCYGYLRRHADERLLILLNFLDDENPVQLPAEGARLLLSTHLDRGDEPLQGVLRLRPNEGVLLRIER